MSEKKAASKPAVQRRFYQTASDEDRPCTKCGRVIEAWDVHWVEEAGEHRDPLCSTCSIIDIDLNRNLTERKRQTAKK